MRFSPLTALARREGRGCGLRRPATADHRKAQDGKDGHQEGVAEGEGHLPAGESGRISGRARQLPAYRSHTCGALRTAMSAATARLSGWVHRVRDHGGLLFIDLRDHYGITQCVVEPDSPAFKAAEKVRAEWVIRVDGTVEARTPETVNPNMPTGEVELRHYRAGRAVRGRRNCRCRCSASRTIRKTRGCNTASSICAARRCTATS